MNDWRQTLQLCQLTLWVMVHKAGPQLLNGKWERASSIIERLEGPEPEDEDDELVGESLELFGDNDDASTDEDEFDELENVDSEFEYFEPDTPWHEHEREVYNEDEPEVLVVPEDEAQSLLEVMGMDLAELIQASHCFQHDAMGFFFLLQMEDLCALFRELVPETEVENFITQYLELSADELEAADLAKSWNGFRDLCFRLHEEAALQWLLAGDLVAHASIVNDTSVATPQEIRQAIEEVITSRNNGRVDLSTKFESALKVVQPRIDEIARTANPDSDRVFELFYQCGGAINCNLAASKVPLAVEAYLRLIAQGDPRG